MRTIVITGSQTGMGYATRRLLETSGVRVIGVSNVGDAEVVADLSTEAGVDGAIAGIEALSQGRLGGVFANAGADSEHAPLTFGLNYFGIVRLLEALRPSLARSGDGRVVVNASNSVVVTPARAPAGGGRGADRRRLKRRQGRCVPSWSVSVFAGRCPLQGRPP